MIKDTIVAISTALQESAISIIRLSGDQAISIANQLFTKDLTHVDSFTIHYGKIVDPYDKQVVDEVLISVFKAPKTYTTEDVIEINCHGGVIVTNRILTLCQSLGARLAYPGEFTQRAYLNGRIDLSQAEATHDLISANSLQAASLATKGVGGSVKQLIEPLMNQIMDMIAHIETNIDYPEYTDVAQLTHQEILPKAYDFKVKVEQIIKRAESGQIIREGLKTVILGKPNVGKSSLLNALLQEDKAIVTDIAGTTRDLVEGWVRLDNVTLHLIDTAGIRETEDVVEKIGIERSKQALAQAQLVIVLLDANTPLEPYDQWLLEETKSKNRIVVTNKNDLNQPTSGISISAKNNDIHQLVDEINVRYANTFELIEQPLLSNQRQIGLIHKAYQSINQAIDLCEMNVELDLVNLDLTECYKHLASILVPIEDINVISEIFSRFCLGK